MATKSQRDENNTLSGGVIKIEDINLLSPTGFLGVFVPWWRQSIITLLV
jgi:hypothetical protein